MQSDEWHVLPQSVVLAFLLFDNHSRFAFNRYISLCRSLEYSFKRVLQSTIIRLDFTCCRLNALPYWMESVFYTSDCLEVSVNSRTY